MHESCFVVLQKSVDNWSHKHVSVMKATANITAAKMNNVERIIVLTLWMGEALIYAAKLNIVNYYCYTFPGGTFVHKVKQHPFKIG